MTASLKVGQKVAILVDNVAYGGHGIARVDSHVVFVPFTAPGDMIETEIVRVKKKYAVGALANILTPSVHRHVPLCSYFARCGGCQYQHVDYEYQLTTKRKHVIDSFERIGKYPLPPVGSTVPSPLVFGYRGKAEYHIRHRTEGKVVVGFIDQRGRQVLDILRCELVHDSINKASELLRAQASSAALPTRYTLWSEHGLSTNLYATRFVKGVRFQVPATGFFQANISLVAGLVDRVVELSGLTGSESVVDCYCGSGLFTVFLGPNAKRLIGIDVDEASVRCAQVNVAQHGLDNVELILGRVDTILSRDLTSRGMAIDLLVVDPPRAGCAPPVLAAITTLKPRRIIYVSCNPTTQARDIRFLVDTGYRLDELVPFDMFPHTYHVEVIARLESNN